MENLITIFLALPGIVVSGLAIYDWLQSHCKK